MTIFLLTPNNQKLSKNALLIKTTLQKMGHQVLTCEPSPATEHADLLIIETNKDSITLGYQIGIFINNRKPVLILHPKDSQLGDFVPGQTDNIYQYITIQSYLPAQIKTILKNYLEELKIDKRRFNFFIASDLAEYLNWVPFAKKKARSEFMRQLIRDQMKKDEEYQAYKKGR